MDKEIKLEDQRRYLKYYFLGIEKIIEWNIGYEQRKSRRKCKNRRNTGKKE